MVSENLRPRKKVDIWCFCGRVKVETATLLISALVLFIVLSDFGYLIYSILAVGRSTTAWTCLRLMNAIAWSFSSCCAMLSVSERNPEYLYPFYVMMKIAARLTIVGAFASLAVFFIVHIESVQLFALKLFIVLLLCIPVSFYFNVIVRRCYRLLKETFGPSAHLDEIYV
uniref:G_PROTEIN_RECEP_F1_2 domain-containing protein n=1 Tax=Steinernema glaseri TaxID=37863 RepID=A0A1I7YG58_9BILA